MLVQAAEAGDFSPVEALIAAGVDVNGATEHGMTALMAAAANGHLALLAFLLDGGADFKAKRFSPPDSSPKIRLISNFYRMGVGLPRSLSCHHRTGG
jgi:ankyrin repeat protein